MPQGEGAITGVVSGIFRHLRMHCFNRRHDAEKCIRLVCEKLTIFPYAQCIVEFCVRLAFIWYSQVQDPSGDWREMYTNVTVQKHAIWPPLQHACRLPWRSGPHTTHTAGIVHSVNIHTTARYTCRSVCVRLCVCRKVYCGKTAVWIRMLFGIVSGVSPMMGVLDGWWSSKGKEQFWW